MDKDIEQFGGTFIIDVKNADKFQTELTFFSSKLGKFLDELHFENKLFNGDGPLSENDKIFTNLINIITIYLILIPLMMELIHINVHQRIWKITW